ncbi:MAG: NAD-dependent protein deacylase [Desulfobacteraceae bacterium]|nr:MAG: NAD-dependent protein deacylase [Desulfobacteraceae bacterium]
MDAQVKKIAQRICTSKQFTVFTGAGISTESGIPDYRSQGGIWDKFKPVYFDEFMSSREDRIRYWNQRMEMEKSLKHSRPNAGHNAIASMFEMGLVHTVITQNIDGLHQASGIPGDKVIELHGNTRRVRCMSCSQLVSWEDAEVMILDGDPAPDCTCGGHLKPDTISFGQAMPMEKTENAARISASSDLFMVVGSTLVVQPAALMPEYAKNAGGFLVILNLSETPYDAVSDIRIFEKAGPVLEQILSEVNQIMNTHD